MVAVKQMGGMWYVLNMDGQHVVDVLEIFESEEQAIAYGEEQRFLAELERLSPIEINDEDLPF